LLCSMQCVAQWTGMIGDFSTFLPCPSVLMPQLSILSCKDCVSSHGFRSGFAAVLCSIVLSSKSLISTDEDRHLWSMGFLSPQNRQYCLLVWNSKVGIPPLRSARQLVNQAKKPLWCWWDWNFSSSSSSTQPPQPNFIKVRPEFNHFLLVF
jgi:hypothetical protein